MTTFTPPAPSRPADFRAGAKTTTRRRRVASLLPRRWDTRLEIEHHGSPSEMALRSFANERGFHR